MTIQRARALFVELVSQVPEEQWEARLAELAGEDIELRNKVAALLAAHRKADSFLEQPAGPLSGTADVQAPGLARPAGEAARGEKLGTVVAGRYKLIEAIGEGGMGRVYLAQQTEPIKRLVALKVIKAGMDSRQVIARFEAERQALALMDHPNIARVLDAGTTESGQPFFAMELVKGVPLTKYCDEHHLTPKQRLELFVPVCQAIQHAHQKGIIHRDIKPSNVLVAPYDGKPVPKVIDFGIAKATGQQLTEHTLVTGIGMVVGTLEYMSPEQAELNQLDIDTRSDIYSLGVLLYELLTGSTPLERKRLKQAAMVEVLRLIREEEPPRPSVRLSASKETLPSISAQRQTEPARLRKLVRGELDWIVMKALDKNRNRRYETANGFAQDIQRYLADEPVQACPPSALYRLRTFVRRNKWPVLAVLLIILALIGGTIGTTLGLFRAQASEERAQDEAWKAGQERDQANTARAAEQMAREAESVLLKQTEEQSKELRKNLYRAEMNLAGQAFPSPFGLARIDQLLDHWQQTKPDLRGWEWYYLYGLCHRDLMTIPLKQVASVAWSPDGARLAAAGGTWSPKVWDAATGKEVVALAGSNSRSANHCVAWSPDGKLLASADLFAVTIWDAVTGKERLSLPLPQGPPDSRDLCNISWAPKGDRLASSNGHEITVWNSATGKKMLVLKGHLSNSRVSQVAWSPDGVHLASVDSFWEAKIWDVTTGKEVLTFASGKGGPVSWNPDGTWFAMARRGYNDGNIIRVCNLAGKEVEVPNSGQSSAVSWSPDGTRLAAGDEFGNVKFWDVGLKGPANGQWTMVNVRAHNAEVRSVSWNPTGTRLASASNDGMVKVWDTAIGNDPLIVKEDGVGPIKVMAAWSPNGKKLASISGVPYSPAKIWDTATATEVSHLKGSNWLTSIAWSPDGTRLATGSLRSQVPYIPEAIRIWDVANGKELLEVNAKDPDVPFPERTGFAVAWNPNGKWLASACYHNATLWNALTGEKIRSWPLTGFNCQENALAWNPAGTHLAIAGNPWVIVLDAAAIGQPSAILNGHQELVTSVVWSPDGTRLASGSRDRTVRVWDVAARKELFILEGHTFGVSSVAWSPDGARLASTGADQTVRFWEAATGKEIVSISFISSRYYRDFSGASLAWSPEGMRLAAFGYRGFGIFDASNGYRRAGQPHKTEE
jgi:WD40 repeat protein/serine/threonine protein kinase